MSDVFVSYASQDKQVADAVCAMCEANRIRCWIAPRDVLPGTDYGEAIVEAIASSRIMVLVLSANSNESDHVKNEVERAVSAGRPIIPLRVQDVLPSGSLALHLSRRHWLDAFTPPLEKHIQHLAETVRLLLSRTDLDAGTSAGPREQPREGADAQAPAAQAGAAAPTTRAAIGNLSGARMPPSADMVPTRKTPTRVKETEVRLSTTSGDSHLVRRIRWGNNFYGFHPSIELRQGEVVLKVGFADMKEATFLWGADAEGHKHSRARQGYALIAKRDGGSAEGMFYRTMRGTPQLAFFRCIDAGGNELKIPVTAVKRLEMVSP